MASTLGSLDPVAKEAFMKAAKEEMDAAYKACQKTWAEWYFETPTTMTCTAVVRNKGEITHTVGKLEDIVNFEVGQTVSYRWGEDDGSTFTVTRTRALGNCKVFRS